MKLDELSPEARLMLDFFNGNTISWCSGFCQEQFFSVALRHRLVNLLCQEYRTQLGELPAGLRQRLLDENARNAVRQLKNVAVLERIEQAFSYSGIRRLVIKGAPLAQLLYADPGARMSRDIDYLVLPKQLEKAENILAQDGFRQKTAATALHSVWINCEGVVIELHTRLNAAGTGTAWPDASGRESPAVSVAIADREYKIPDLAEYFVYLCWHGAAHGWYRLIWLQDVIRLGRLLSNAEADVYAAASKQGMTDICGQGLILSRLLFATGETGFNRCCTARAFELARGAFELALANPKPLDDCFNYRDNPWREFSYQLSVQGTLAAKIRYILMPTVEDRRQLKLPRNREWLHILLRPLLLLVRIVNKYMDRMSVKD